MKRMTGVGGIFFKARDPEGLGPWAMDPEQNRIELWEPPPGQ